MEIFADCWNVKSIFVGTLFCVMLYLHQGILLSKSNLILGGC